MITKVRILLAWFIIKLQKDYVYPAHCYYYFNFSSLISPLNLINLNLFFSKTNQNKVYAKQIYIFLTWFYYLNYNTTNKIKLILLPKKKKIYTLVKAPMAHKNWSKEQFSYSYFNFKFKIKMNAAPIHNLNYNFFILLLIKKNLIYFETNFFFIKYYVFFIIFKDNFFFKI